MATADTAGPCRILELPVELIEMIVLYSDTSGLLNLRSTCKELEAKTRSVVTDCCFTDPVFLLADRTSMGHLLALSKHPVFSQHIITITFGLRMLCRASDMQCRMRSLPEYVTMDPRQQRSALRERQRVYQQFKDDEQRFRGEQEAILFQVFRNFLEIGRLPAICTVGDEHDGEGTTLSGLARLQRILGHPNPLQSASTRLPRNACNTVLRAIVTAGYPPLALSLHTGGRQYMTPGDEGVHLSNLCLPTTSFRPTLLVHLSMTVDLGGIEDYSDDNFDEEFDEDWEQVIQNISRLSALLVLATDLTALNLGTSWNQEAWKRDKIFFAVMQTKTMDQGPALMKLRSVKLENVAISDFGELLDWAKLRRGTLHVVEVTGSLPRSVVESGQDPNAEIWDTIWTVEKRDMKVLIGVRGPGMARGKHCDAWQDEKRKQRWLPWRRHRYGGGHQNDDCDCPRVDGWQNRTGSALYAGHTLHQSGRSARES